MIDPFEYGYRLRYAWFDLALKMRCPDLQYFSKLLGGIYAYGVRNPVTNKQIAVVLFDHDRRLCVDQSMGPAIIERLKRELGASE